MKKILLFAALLLTGSMTFAQSLTSGIDPQNLDTSVRPGDDFYHYAAGGWLKNNPLDDEHTDNGAFTDLYEKPSTGSTCSTVTFSSSSTVVWIVVPSGLV